MGRDGGEGEGKGEGGVGGPTITLLNINFLQILMSLSLGARGFFFALLGTTEFSGKAAKGRLAIQHLAL